LSAWDITTAEPQKLPGFIGRPSTAGYPSTHPLPRDSVKRGKKVLNDENFSRGVLIPSAATARQPARAPGNFRDSGRLVFPDDALGDSSSAKSGIRKPDQLGLFEEVFSVHYARAMTGGVSQNCGKNWEVGS
jgi:hypothetical protein